MAELVRSFIAVELSQEVRGLLAQVQDELRRSAGGQWARWVAPESIHLTLKFLGNVPTERIDAVATAADRATGGVAPFTLATGDLGVFPPRGTPRVIWMGLTGQLDRLRGLQASVEREVTPLGFPTESRAFSPHLTLGRVREGAPAGLLRALGQAVAQTQLLDQVPLSVSSITLMQSQLGCGGAVYTPLTKHVLHGN